MKRTSKPKITKKQLQYYLFKTYLTLPKIAQKLNTTRHWIIKLMEEYNLERTSEYNHKVQCNRVKLMKESLTIEQKQEAISKSKQTKLKRYGNENYNNMDKNKHTKLDRYGNENYNNMDKMYQTMVQKYGVKNYTQKRVQDNTFVSPFKNKSTQLKSKQTKLLRYGDENYNNPRKNLITYSKNQSQSRMSKPEKLLYEKLRMLNYNITIQYLLHSHLYDFKLDNLVIDFHGIFWHNKVPFKNTIDNINEYNKLIKKGGLYKTVADTWRYKDIKRKNIVLGSKLRYLAIYYPNNEFKVYDDNTILIRDLDEAVDYIKNII